MGLPHHKAEPLRDEELRELECTCPTLRLRLCRRRPSSRLLAADLDEKRQFIVMAESGCIKPNLLSRGGPEVGYFLQGGVSGEGSLWAKPSWPLGTSLACRTLLWAYVTAITSLFLLSCSEMLGMPHLHVEGLGVLPFVTDGHKSLCGGCSYRGLVLGAGGVPIVPSGSLGLQAFSSALPDFLSWSTTLPCVNSYCTVLFRNN